MFNVCPGCGEFSDDKAIEPWIVPTPVQAFAVCQSCGHKHRFRRLPLLVVTGASGTGKSTVALQLAPMMEECVCLESDILWRDEFNQPDDDYLDYRNLWLRMAKNINQAGRPVVLFGSCTPGQFERCHEHRYFSDSVYLALICHEEELIRRLQARPQWRNSGSDEVLDRMTKFNRWLQENAETSTPKMTLLDTTILSEEDSTIAVRSWIFDQLRLAGMRAKRP